MFIFRTLSSFEINLILVFEKSLIYNNTSSVTISTKKVFNKHLSQRINSLIYNLTIALLKVFKTASF